MLAYLGQRLLALLPTIAVPATEATTSTTPMRNRASSQAGRTRPPVLFVEAMHEIVPEIATPPRKLSTGRCVRRSPRPIGAIMEA